MLNTNFNTIFFYFEITFVKSQLTHKNSTVFFLTENPGLKILDIQMEIRLRFVITISINTNLRLTIHPAQHAFLTLIK